MGTSIPATVAFSAPTRFGLLDLFEGAYGANLIGCTIARVRGYYAVVTPAAAASAYRLGIKVSDNRVLPDSAESLFNPSEIGGAHDDWMSMEGLYSGPAASNLSDLVTARLVDVKAMRKLQELGERLELHISGSAGIDTAASIAYDLSILVMLP